MRPGRALVVLSLGAVVIATGPGAYAAGKAPAARPAKPTAPAAGKPDAAPAAKPVERPAPAAVAPPAPAVAAPDARPPDSGRPDSVGAPAARPAPARGGPPARGGGDGKGSGAGKKDAAPALSRYIVRFRPGTDPGSAAAEAAKDGEVDTVLRHVFPGAVVRLPEKAALTLAERNPNVESVEPDTTVRAIGTQGSATWGLDRVDQRALPLSGSYAYAADGAGVAAYVVDTGVRPDHVELAGRVRAGYDAFGGTSVDCHGHGTHVAGTIAGTTWGVAKASAVVAVRVLDCTGSGTMSGVIAGVDWAVADHLAGVPAVLNLSLGGGRSDSLDLAVASAVADGITVTAAAGNDDADACTSSPARAVEALTVGATDSSDRRASFSNWGGCLDLFAPGVGITSATDDSATATGTWSGTSMAAPHVAGAAAVLLAQAPSLTPAQVATRLLDGATAGVVGAAGTGSPNRLLFSSPEPLVQDPPAVEQPDEPAADEPVAAAPAAPARVTAEPLRKAATVTWVAGSDGGSPITSYTVRVRQGGKLVKSVKVSATTSSTTISGLRPKTAYTFGVVATNAVGTSAETTSSPVSTLQTAAVKPAAKPTVARRR